MITTPKDYLELLYLIQDRNRPTQMIQCPKDETVYNIDLTTRKVDAPTFLSVENDHNAETVYFKVDRYFDNVDLARDDIYVIVQYENANPDTKKRGYVYAPPFIDVTTFAEENKIAFPWVIEGPATAYAGTVKFAIKFYRINSETNEYDFNLNTLTSESKVLVGMDAANIENSENYIFTASELDKILYRMNEISEQNDLYWIEIT